MPTAKARPADFTGRQKSVLEEQAAKEKAARAEEITLINEVEKEAKKEVVDYTQPHKVTVKETPKVEVKDKVQTIRVNSDIEKMTFGKNPDGTLNMYDFEEGRSYKVPTAVAEHLESKGYLWH